MAADLDTRRRLYDAGKNDVEIARAQGLDKSSVRAWRKRNGLCANFLVAARSAVPQKPAGRRDSPLTAEAEAQRSALYREGLTDWQIGAKLERSPKSIRTWRCRRGLPPNVASGERYRYSQPSERETRRVSLLLLKRGVGARLVSKELNVPLKSVERWRTQILRDHPELRRPGTAPRRRPQHPSGRAYSRLRPERRLRAFALYAEGKTDPQIAAEIGTTRAAIWEWRGAFFLAPNVPPGGIRRVRKPQLARRCDAKPISPRSDPLYAMLADAVGRGISPDLADDAISDMWVAIAAGDLAVEDVAASARRFRNKVLGLYASSSTRSLDEEIGQSDGFKLLDLIRDERSSSWLEDMGATVW